MPPVVTRFAPRPPASSISAARGRRCSTGSMPATTGGRFQLRIEDTDRERSTEAGDRRDPRRAELARPRLGRRDRSTSSPAPRAMPKSPRQLLDAGKAYRSTARADELNEMREAAQRGRRPLPAMTATGATATPATPRRASSPSSASRRRWPARPSIESTACRAESRSRTRTSTTSILLRSDGTPTYMLVRRGR